jgi:hypothetical protein
MLLSPSRTTLLELASELAEQHVPTSVPLYVKSRRLCIPQMNACIPAAGTNSINGTFPPNTKGICLSTGKLCEVSGCDGDSLGTGPTRCEDVCA